MKFIVFFVLIVAARLSVAADLSGDWMAQVTRFGQAQYVRVTLRIDGGKLAGTWNQLKLDGEVTGNHVTFSLDQPDGKVSGTFAGEIGTAELSGDGKISQRGTMQPITWKMTRLLKPPADGPKTWDFEPREFQVTYSASIDPALHIFPGDTVRTWLLDDEGVDSKGQQRAAGTNPQIGPFYIEGALPGDTLVVKLNKVRTNRDTAQSGTRIKPNIIDPAYAANAKYAARFDSEWKLDPAKGVATLVHPTDRMKNYTVPILPMIGCVATAPPFNQAIRTLDLGPFGGNMDYNQLGEGATVYLPVFAPGALLFMGDGHAAMGDGEVTFAAVETSLDVDFTVDLIRGSATPGPRLENRDYLMSAGIAGSLADAVQNATSQLANWLKKDYKLTDNEVALVLGTVIKYDIAEMVDPQYNVVAKVPKTALAAFK